MAFHPTHHSIKGEPRQLPILLATAERAESWLRRTYDLCRFTSAILTTLFVAAYRHDPGVAWIARTPRGLSAEEVRQLLTMIPETPVGKRDRAIILMLLLTGRRRAEVLNLTAGNIEPGDPAFYTYRGKGGTRGRRELPRPAYVALVAALSAFNRDLATMDPTASIWPTSAHTGGVSSGSVGSAEAGGS